MQIHRKTTSGFTNLELEKHTLFELPLANSKMRDAVSWIIDQAKAKNKTTLNFVNAHCINICENNNNYFRALERSEMLFPDGSGVSLAFKLQGKATLENLNGTDVFPHLCKQAELNNLSLYLLGGQEGIAKQVALNMVERYPNLQISGTHHGFFSEEDIDELIDSINASEADILLVAMGVPYQEIWLDKYAKRLRPSVSMGVGGLFDFYSGRISRAPIWLRRVGMEWIWRLRQEPTRMWQRYLLGNPIFVIRALREAAAQKRQRFLLDNPKRSRAYSMCKHFNWWLSTGASPKSKRVLDIFGASVALLFASPLVLLAVFAIRAESSGPAFFSQQRVGLRGINFKLWKLRSMYTDAEARKESLQSVNEVDGGVLFKIKQDPRITHVGRIIRRFSVDELPQLWNVLCGDMALVGPRPALPDEVIQYNQQERLRLAVRPGITCIWQVSGRSNIPFDRQVEMDVEYINRSSLGTDVQLLIKTVPAVLSGHGAY